MEKEQIIKALECCAKERADCNECPLDGVTSCFSRVILENALSLIKELTEENERLNDELKKRPKKLVITKLNTEEVNK
jgi:hypothetical protein